MLQLLPQLLLKPSTFRQPGIWLRGEVRRNQFPCLGRFRLWALGEELRQRPHSSIQDRRPLLQPLPPLIFLFPPPTRALPQQVAETTQHYADPEASPSMRYLLSRQGNRLLVIEYDDGRLRSEEHTSE